MITPRLRRATVHLGRPGIAGTGVNAAEKVRLQPMIEGAPGAGYALRQGPDGTPRWGRDVISADWFSSVNAAIAKAKEVGSGAGIVGFSKGVTYDEPGGDPVLLTTGVTLEGEDPATSRIRNIYPDATALQVAVPANLTDRPIVRNLRVYGDNIATVGVDWRGITRGLLENVEISGFTDAQLWFGGDSATHNAGWSNTVFKARITAPSNGCGIRFSGKMSGSGSSTANRNSLYSCSVTALNAPTSIAVDLREGDSNMFFGGDYGYNTGGIAFLLGPGAYLNEFFGGTCEAIHRSVRIEGGDRNAFHGWHFATSAAPNHPVELLAGSTFNAFIMCEVSEVNMGGGVTEPGIWDADPANGTIVIGRGVGVSRTGGTQSYIARNTTDLQLRLRTQADANERFAITGGGALRWLDPANGATITTLSRTSPSFKSLAWDDDTIIPVPKMTGTNPPPAVVNRRGALVRTEGGAGVADRLFWYRKKADDTYEFIQIV